MKTAEIAQRFLDFFEKKNHTIVPSASLVTDDPALLFTVAGMVPFIPYLSGVVPPPYPRAADVQKCIRTFDPKDLWVTVYEEDDEAHDLWLTLSTLPEERIQRLGKDTNYWSTGLPGPAGPCSEIFFDRGPAYGIDGGPATDDDRYVEIWNLVFMQYEITNVRSKYDFDIVGEDLAAKLAGKAYGAESHEDDVRLRIVADHVRSSLMLLADGVTPSNEGRGYILRRIMRRAIRSMRLLGVEGATFPELFAASRDAMKESYPEVEADYARLSAYAIAEEQTFLRTLAAGSAILDQSVAEAKNDGGTTLSGSEAFLLHDTYGFPIDLTLEIAEEAGLSVDRGAFDQLMQEQRTRAKADARARKGAIADQSAYREFRALGETVFTGYTELQTESKVLGILVDGQGTDRASAGQIAEIITGETALYAESGGQVADKGTIVGPGYELEVLDVQRPVPGLISHTVEVTTGEVSVGAPATTVVDALNRHSAQQAHSATHLVHAAIRDTLGKTATQTGSLNRAGYMRFDFSWGSALSPETRTEIEDIANNAVRDNLEVTTRVMSLDEAKAAGAMALFGEKYGDTVRMVDIGGPWSRELCGGTHVARSAEIGLVNLVGEQSVGASNRRVEALVGLDAFRDLAAERAIVSQLSTSLKTPREQLTSRIAELAASLKAAEKKIAAFEAQALTGRLPQLVEAAVSVGTVRVVAESLGEGASADDVRSLALQVRDRLGTDPAVVALASVAGGRATVVVVTNESARERGLTAGALAKAAAGVLGGGGGGRPDVAQGGGTDAAALPQALEGIVADVRATTA
ncbi:MAG: alanyl-tRNA synthetase [Microbacterium sp.]|nr:alanyl-tRNA synthetase [Microbacterium sp.]